MFRTLLRSLEQARYRLASRDGLVKKRINGHLMYLDIRDKGLP